MIIAVSSLVAPPDQQEALEEAFRRRQKLVDGFPGFRRLQLTKARGSNEYFLFLQWDDMASFRSYVKSEAFHHAHPPTTNGVEPGPLRFYDVILDSDRGE